MRFSQFRQVVQKLPFFSVSHIRALTDKRKLLENQLAQWEKEAKVIRLKRGLYTLGQEENQFTLSKTLVANQLLSPSYVSLEFALSFYDLIPEKVEDVTSVTTKKTSLFKNAYGVFRYQHIKPSCFMGFIRTKDDHNFPIFMAEPEKAVVDFLYLNLGSIPKVSKEIFYEFYRFQNMEDLSVKKLRRYAAILQTKKLNQIVKLLVEHIKGRKKR